MTLVSAACSAAATPSPSVAPSGTSATSAPAATKAGPATPVVLPPAETTKITIGIVNIVSIGLYVNELAKSLGIFQKYGLDVTVIPFEGAGPALQGLVAEQIQAAEVSAGSAISAALTDSPLVITTLDSTGLAYSLVAGKDIKSAADLRGKSVAISSFGSVSHAAALAALSQLGLKSSDVTIQIMGSESSRTAAVTSGAVAAVPVSTVNAQKLVELGLNVLVDLTKTPIKFAVAGLTMTKAWASKNPNTILRTIAAQLEAQKVMFTKQPLAIAAWAAYTGMDAAAAKASIEACVAGVCNKGLRFTKDDLTLNKEVLVTVSPAASTVDLASIMDLSYLDKLQQLGFNAELQFP